MATLMDIHGNKYHIETKGSRATLVGESGEQVTEVIDVGTHLYVLQPDGTWRVNNLVNARANEVTHQQIEEARAQDARAKGTMGV